MPGGEDFFPPVQYAPWWMLLGLLLLALVVGWYIWVYMSTRAPRPAAEPQPWQNAQMIHAPAVRERYLSMITETQRAHDSGALPYREAHHQLSLLLRSYVAERQGIQTIHMTLDDLKKTKLVPLSTAIEDLYPAAFGPEAHGSIDVAAEKARKLVREWT